MHKQVFNDTSLVFIHVRVDSPKTSECDDFLENYRDLEVFEIYMDLQLRKRCGVTLPFSPRRLDEKIQIK